MAKRKRSSPRGFAPTARDSNENPGYETIFEKIVEKSKGESKSFIWYTAALRSYTDGLKLILEEQKDRGDKQDTQDENVLRLVPKQGHMYFYEYEAKSRWLPFYDKFPLCYVISIGSDYFYAANLHYLAPKQRVYVINDLKRGKINIPRNIIHKYLRKHVKSFFLDLAEEEWETSILLPVENFVKTSGSGKTAFEREDVWKQIDTKDKLKAERVIRDYGR